MDGLLSMGKASESRISDNTVERVILRHLRHNVKPRE